jgi:hypothetical protein
MSLLYIILGIGFLALQFFSSAKAQQREARPQSRPVASDDDEAMAADPVAEDDWMSVFTPEQNVMETGAYEQDGFQKEYFSYENVDVETAEMTSNETVAAPLKQEVADTQATETEKRFDLRQAFIYQTILNRVEC